MSAKEVKDEILKRMHEKWNRNPYHILFSWDELIPCANIKDIEDAIAELQKDEIIKVEVRISDGKDGDLIWCGTREEYDYEIKKWGSSAGWLIVDGVEEEDLHLEEFVVWSKAPINNNEYLKKRIEELENELEELKGEILHYQFRGATGK